MKPYDYLIVGAGLFGAVFAHEALKEGFRCLVIDRRRHVGGNLLCSRIAGITVHEYGPHIFHTDSPEVWAYMNAITPFSPYIHRPLASSGGKLFSMPFNMKTYRQMWGVKSPEEARAAMAAEKPAAGEEPDDLESMALQLVGRELYEKLIRGYTEKQWGRPASELPASVIKRIPVRFDDNDAYFDDRYQGIPCGGYNGIFDRLLYGAELRLGVDYLKDRRALSDLASVTVYTGMLDAFYDECYGSLDYRSLRFEHQCLDVPDHQGVAVVNYPDRGIPFTRIIEHRHFAAAEHGDAEGTVITREYPAPWEKGAEAFYPVNDAASRARFERYRKRADAEQSTLFGGRLADYRYYDMDDAVAAALALYKRHKEKRGKEGCG